MENKVKTGDAGNKCHLETEAVKCEVGESSGEGVRKE